MLRFLEAAAVPELWPEALHELAAACGAHAAISHLVTPGRETRFSCSRAYAEWVDDYVKGGWNVSNGRMERCMALVARGWRGIITEQDTFTPDELARDPFHQEFARPRGLNSFAGAIVASAPGMMMPIAIERRKPQEPFSRPEAAVLNRLIPHIQAAAGLAIRIADSAAMARVDTFSQLGQAAALIGHDGRALAINQPFEQLVGDGIRLAAGRTEAERGDAEAALASTLARAVRFAGPDDEPLLPVVLPRGNGRRPLIAQATPTVGAAGDLFRSACAILILTDLDAAAKPAVMSVLRQAFGLTPAEGRLAVRLAAGETLESAAAAEGIAQETARSRIKAVFAKTDTHRQSQLIALLARLPTGLGPGDRDATDRHLPDRATE